MIVKNNDSLKDGDVIIGSVQRDQYGRDKIWDGSPAVVGDYTQTQTTPPPFPQWCVTYTLTYDNGSVTRVEAMRGWTRHVVKD